MVDISFNIACKELKIAQIAKLNQLFQLLHLDRMHGHGFYELSRILMRKNVNNDVSKDSPYSAMQKRLYLGREVTQLYTRIITKSIIQRYSGAPARAKRAQRSTMGKKIW